jgi:hypothetical protein
MKLNTHDRLGIVIAVAVNAAAPAGIAYAMTDGARWFAIAVAAVVGIGSTVYAITSKGSNIGGHHD